MHFSVQSNLSLFMFIFLIFSCSSANSNKPEENGQSKFSSDEATNEGFSMGIVKFSKESKCQFTIMDVETQIEYDPINFHKEEYSSYKKEDTKIFFKFLPLRMMSRCHAQPIEILGMKHRN